MRRILTVILGVFAILVLLIGGLRGITQRDSREVFPLPEADGCWLGMCFAGLRADQVERLAASHPNVEMQTFATGPDTYHLLLDDGRREVGLVLNVQQDYFTLARDWQVPDNPEMLRAGDVVAALGSPDSLRLSNNGISLYYLARGLEIVVSPGRTRWPQVLPELPVRVVQTVVRVEASPTARAVLPPGADAHRWHGFGIYWGVR